MKNGEWIIRYELYHGFVVCIQCHSHYGLVLVARVGLRGIRGDWTR